MKYLIRPATSARRATHKNPAGELFTVRELSDDVQIFGPATGIADNLGELAPFTPDIPVTPVPVSISRVKFIMGARKFLNLREGEIYALISQIEDDEQQEDARDLFENAQTFRRDNALLLAVASLQGLDDGAVDQFFRDAAALPL